MDFSLLSEILTVFALSVGVIYVCHKVRVPAIVGFLITGVIAGPYGLGLVHAVHEVEVMAEVGVVLLLFTIGLELSVGELARLRKNVLVGGGGQVALTIAAFGLLAFGLGKSPSHAVFVGFLAALSSTAIVLKILQQRAEMDSVHGRIVLSILIFQDLAVVPMMLLVPFLAGTAGGGGDGLAFLWPTVKGLGLVVLVFLAARKVVPVLLHRVVQTRSRELFLISTLSLCLATAFLTSKAGLSLSLGAFLAGLVISESEYSISALEGILPFRDVFTSLFFVSVGMLLDVSYLAAHLPPVLGATGAVIVLKAAMATLAAYLLGYPLRPALMAGLALSQIGEFSFVLAKVGLDAGLVDADGYQLFLAASIVTMVLTPTLMALAPRVADALRAAPLFSTLSRRPFEREMNTGSQTDAAPVSDHLVIVGFGVGGRQLARAAKNFGIDYRIVEMNPDTVRNSAAEGEPISYGDASQPAVLEHLGVDDARVLAIMVNDPASVRRITDTARKMNPRLHIIARTRFVSEIEPLVDLGASDVIPEEFETSVEIFTRVMMRYLVPRADIETFTDEVRAEGYEMLRVGEVRGESFCTLNRRFPGMDVSALTVEEGSALDGQTLEESGLRRIHGLTVVAVGRGGEYMANPDGSLRLLAGDVAYVFAPYKDIKAKAGLFTGRSRPWRDDGKAATA